MKNTAPLKPLSINVNQWLRQFRLICS